MVHLYPLKKTEPVASSSSSSSTTTTIMENNKFPVASEFYQLYEEIGRGASASVYRALCTPLQKIVAIKIIDFEDGDLSNIAHEAQRMILVDHPNVLKAHCSFASGQNIWVVMPYMDGGSCLHILKAAFPEGFREVVIATVLREALKGLEYLHDHGLIHRDVKAGNILVDAHGGIKLGDLGVSACLFDSVDRLQARKTFVGTPCWMAPEVMEQLHGYDFKADIWSFGITALELAHGHAPFSKHPPHKVLIMTLQNAPPGLTYERDKKFSKSFKQMIAMCLVKDPHKRPSAKKLLKHPFFKSGKSNESIVRTMLEGLPTLGERLESLKIKEAEMVAQKKISDVKKEELSQSEYKRGISEWNFNIEDLKEQASLIHDFEETIPGKDQGSSLGSLSELDAEIKPPQCQPSFMSHSLKNDYANKEDDTVLQNKEAAHPFGDLTIKNLSDKQQPHVQNMVSGNGTVLPQAVGGPSAKLTGANGNHVGNKMEGHVVQQKGRFKVTSEDVDVEKEATPCTVKQSYSGESDRAAEGHV
ncbi:hypothetical protein AQUCO_03100051v1 [Aquilegia coerulea]|uniref:Protein kinase domain-containing protein n=1 Tax=Aquilegia coerulea TaxID=218851 RepID=A0A2G5D0J0_AQUCA|nr:hypothetical protein AQUCO_03100051v1 [Aquilegia coerulea]